jgi:hypothetical protein
MSEATLISGAFAEFLEVNRGTLNHEVAAVARQSSGFDAVAFGEALRTSVAPIVDAVDRLGTGFVAVVSETLFRVSLDLCAQRRFDGAVREGWDRLLPAVVPQLTADPHGVVASITNALDSLQRAPGARPQQWIELLLAAAPHAPTPEALLQAGQVAAWRSGMAAYRSGALDLAATLDPALAAAALGLPVPDPGSDEGAATGATRPVAEVLDRLRGDPWFEPTAPDGRAGGGPTVRIGGFRGFGGTFLRPPRIITASDQRVLVTDGESSWYVFADAFGTALVRAATPTVAAPDGAGPATDAPPGELADVAEVTTWVRTAAGVVATSGLDHSVRVVRSPS